MNYSMITYTKTCVIAIIPLCTKYIFARRRREKLQLSVKIHHQRRIIASVIAIIMIICLGTSTRIWKMGARMANFVFRQISGSPIDLSTKSLAKTFSLRSYERSKLSLQEAFLHIILTQKSVTLRMYELNLVETQIV